MRTRWLSVLLGSVIGLTLVASTTSDVYAQKHYGGGGYGGHYGGYGGHYGGYGGHYGGYGGHYGGWGGYGGWGIGVYSGPGYYHHGYGYGYPYYSNYYSGSYYPSYTYGYPNYNSYYSQPDYTDTSEYQSSYYSPPQQQPTGPITDVSILDGSFSPAVLNVNVGTTVRWTNKGQKMHNVAQPHNDWQSRDLGPGESYMWTFKEPGTYTLNCSIHPQKMVMTVNVK